MRSRFEAEIKIDNDANAAALAETKWGVAKGYRKVFYATIGTGIGTGIVFDGKIYHGHTGAAGEGGTWESICAGRGATAASADALKHWLPGLVLRGASAKSSRRIQILCCWKWREAIPRQSTATWWQGLTRKAIQLPAK